jgi:hypothetical protein
MQYRRQVSYQSDIMIGSWYSEFKQLYVYKVPAQTEVARAWVETKSGSNLIKVLAFAGYVFFVYFALRMFAP